MWSATRRSAFTNTLQYLYKRYPKGEKERNEDSLLFADDLAHLKEFDVINLRVEQEMNEHLEEIYNWNRKWRLKMAPEKCAYIIFSKNKKSQHLEWLKLRLGEKSIPNESIEGIKFLGITLDRYCNFNKHIESLKSKSIDRINIIKHLSSKKYCLNENTLIQLYKSIVRSVIDYSSIIVLICKKKNLANLEAIQNTALRHIFRQKYDKTNGLITNESLLGKAQIDTIEKRSKQLTIKYIRENLANVGNDLITNLCIDHCKNVKEMTNSNDLTPLGIIETATKNSLKNFINF